MGDLFEGARKGDPAAEAEILRLLRAFARQVCQGGGPTGALDTDWEDVAQEACRKVFTSGLSQFRGTGVERSYLYSIVRSTVIQMSRGATRRQLREAVIPLDAIAPHSNPAPRLDVDRILSRLPIECRDLMTRVFLKEASYADLAREMNIEESSVRSRLSRCVKHARRIAEEDRTA